jgi:two-component system, cell cycle response regulator
MSLQRRLTVFFIVIVILPLAVAGIVVQRILAHEIDRRAELSLDPALEAAATAYVERADTLQLRVREAARFPTFGRRLERARGRRPLDGFLSRVRASDPKLDFLIVTDASNDVIGADIGAGDWLEGYEQPTMDELATPSSSSPFVSSVVQLRDTNRKQVGQLVGGFWIDSGLLVGYTPQMVDLSILVGDEVIASTALRRVQEVDTGRGRFETVLDEEVTAKTLPLQNGPSLLATTPHTEVGGLSTQVVLIGLLLLAAMGTAIIGYWLARLITHPLEELSHGAQAITEGNFDHEIPIRSRDEVGRVAVAFNEMTAKLRETINELSSSRTQLERAVRRVGETLRSTHDMKQMLESIVNTAADAVQADAAVLWMFTATRESVYPAIIRGVVGRSMESIKVGEGIAGQVAERGNSIVLPGDEVLSRRARSEPDFPVTAAIPLYSQARLMGVLTVYRKDPEQLFTRADTDTVIFLAEQGGVAIENVLLHEDAQRLSLTDGLTGVWNRRYFQMQFRQVLATASRFDRPFSIMMLDLDHFKRVNDTHGHQRGDAILVEFSQRVSGALREIDTFARYGGEEFICLLAETGLGGAATTAEKIREVIKSQPFGGVGDEPISLTVSIGVASYPEHGDSFRGLVEAADQAMYRAKQEGRDRVRTAGSQLKLAT